MMMMMIMAVIRASARATYSLPVDRDGARGGASSWASSAIGSSHASPGEGESCARVNPITRTRLRRRLLLLDKFCECGEAKAILWDQPC